MKKFAIGCGVFALLLAICGGLGLYYFVYRPARTFVASMSELGQVAELDAKVANTRAFAAPADGALTDAQVKRFVAVQESIHARLGARAREFETKYRAIADSNSENRSVSEVVGAYRDVFGLIAEARRAQVEALNAQSFSLTEYAWVKTRFYEAAGVALSGIDFREIAGQMQQGNFEALQTMASSSNAGDAPAAMHGDTPGIGIPDANRTLVAPYKDKLQTWFVYSAFGL